MLTVCVATTSFPRWEGDYHGTFIWEACRALSALGVRVLVVAPHAAGAKTHEEWTGVEIFRPRYLRPERWEVLLDTPGGLPVVWEAGGVGRLSVLPLLAAQTLAVARIARTCDLIHANWTFSAFAAFLGAPVHRCPIVCTVQGSDIYRAARIPVAGFFSRRALRGARRVIALSGSLAESAAMQGVDPGRIAVIPNGVDAERFHPNGIPREPVVLFAGSLIERKGLHILLEAMARVRRRHPAHRLVVIGDGPRRAELETQARALGIGEAVFFTGSLSPEEVARWMRRAELFVLPSFEEGQGVALLEALASGTPGIAGRAGGIPDVLSPRWGELVEPGNPEALADSILGLLDSPARRQAMGRAAAAGVRATYDWPVIARRILGVYREAIDISALSIRRVGNSGQV
jgi:glycosyltransferase involved in cell wall biosynthesis